MAQLPCPTCVQGVNSTKTQRYNKKHVGAEHKIKVNVGIFLFCLRSTTKVKEVPITKRNRDMFSAAARSKPGPIAKSKSVSFYTKPFLWQAQQSTEQVE